MELSEAQYERIKDALPVQRWNVSLSNLQVLNAVRYVAEQGCKWRGLPKRFGRWHIKCAKKPTFSPSSRKHCHVERTLTPHRYPTWLHSRRSTCGHLKQHHAFTASRNGILTVTHWIGRLPGVGELFDAMDHDIEERLLALGAIRRVKLGRKQFVKFSISLRSRVGSLPFRDL
jgi:transposase